MSRPILALTIAGLVALAGCTPAPTEAVPAANQPIPASSGVLQAVPAATEDVPPTLVLETPDTMSRAYRDQGEDTTIYAVIINAEEQYSVWPADQEVPLGWRDVGKKGLKQECFEYIQQVWTDMRPLSLRKKMAEVERQRRGT